MATGNFLCLERFSAQVEALERMVGTDKRLKENFRSDDRVEQMRRNRSRAEMEQEMLVPPTMPALRRGTGRIRPPYLCRAVTGRAAAEGGRTEGEGKATHRAGGEDLR